MLKNITFWSDLGLNPNLASSQREKADNDRAWLTSSHEDVKRFCVLGTQHGVCKFKESYMARAIVSEECAWHGDGASSCL
jgi:hypothetical protein